MIFSNIIPIIELSTSNNKLSFNTRPVIFNHLKNTMIVYNEYKHRINKSNPITYFWIVYQYGEILYYNEYKKIDIENNINRFAIAYAFEYIKNKKYSNFIEIIKNDTYLQNIKNCKYYFDNSNFIINST
jgi:hypothetical protein